MNAHRFKADFDDALKVMWDFNAVVAHGPSPRREADLPYGKGRIRNALVYIYAAVHRDAVRAVIEKECAAQSAAHFLSKEFGGEIQSLIFTLPDFVSDEDAAVVAWFRSQRVPLPPGPPETLVERLAVTSNELRARIEAQGGYSEQFLENTRQYCAIVKRTYEEGNGYLEEALKFDLF